MCTFLIYPAIKSISLSSQVLLFLVLHGQTLVHVGMLMLAGLQTIMPLHELGSDHTRLLSIHQNILTCYKCQ